MGGRWLLTGGWRRGHRERGRRIDGGREIGEKDARRMDTGVGWKREKRREMVEDYANRNAAENGKCGCVEEILVTM